MTFNSDGIVLYTKSWPKQAKLAVLYTKRFGKLKGVVRGAQKVNSKIIGHLPHFAISHIMFAKGRSIDTIAQARLEQPFSSIQKNWMAYTSASYILELVNRLTEEGVADIPTWELILRYFSYMNEQALWSLDSALDKYQFSLLSRQFGFSYICHLGYKPQLYQCIHCESILIPTDLFFSFLQGGCLCMSCSHNYPDSESISVDLIKILRELSKISDSLKFYIPANLRVEFIYFVDKMVSIYTHKPLNSARITI